MLVLACWHVHYDHGRVTSWAGHHALGSVHRSGVKDAFFAGGLHVHPAGLGKNV